jgi:hypothetical protein
MVAFVIVLWIVTAMFCTYLANEKDRSPLAWFILGVLFGPIALLALGFVPVGSKQCQTCAETIRRQAKVCPHCGTKFEPNAEEEKTKQERESRMQQENEAIRETRKRLRGF